MSTTAGNYSVSRFNRVGYGSHVDGPMPCPGEARCHLKYCQAEYPSTSVGKPCPWEQEFSRRFLAQFHETWAALKIWPDVDDFDALATEALNIDLQRTRCITRLNHSTLLMMQGRDSWAKASRESRLANLYLDRLRGRQRRLEDELVAGVDRMRIRAEDLSGGKLRAIEMYLLGKQHAAAESDVPFDPMSDPFIAGTG